VCAIGQLITVCEVNALIYTLAVVTHHEDYLHYVFRTTQDFVDILTKHKRGLFLHALFATRAHKMAVKPWSSFVGTSFHPFRFLFFLSPAEAVVLLHYYYYYYKNMSLLKCTYKPTE
jgi:hypothetical protein